MKKVVLIGVILVVVVGLILSGCAKPAPEQIVLKAVSFLPKGASPLADYGVYIDMVNERANGELVIDWIGGGEAIPRFDQAEAVRTGVVDMTAGPFMDYKDLAPAGMSLFLSDATPMEEHENGFYDFIADVLAETNFRYIGRMETNVLFNIGVKERIERPQELKGLRIRTAPIYDSFLKALGTVPTTINQPEVYSALERGLVDGYAFPFTDVKDLSLCEVVPYFIDHTFYEAGNILAIMNLDKWNSLPEHLQDLMLDTLIDFEPGMVDRRTASEKESRQSIIDCGMETITFSPADAKWYRDLAYSVMKEDIKAEVDPATLAKITELTGK